MPACSARSFWPDGQLKLQKDGSNTTTFSYDHDSQGRLTSMTDALGQTTSYSYDPAGRIIVKTDPANSCGVGVSCVTSYSYNKAHQPLTVTYSDGVTPNVAFTYRVNGQQATMVDGTGTTTSSYDSLGRLVSHTDGAGVTIGYGYNLRGLQTQLVYPGSKTVTRAYDDAGRIDSITDWAGRVFDYTLDANSNITTVAFPAGSTNSDVMAYNNADQLTSTLMKQGAANLVSLTYAIDKSDRLTQETRAGTPGVPGASRRYGYSKLDQLCFDAASTATGGTCATPPTGAQPYTYSPADNLTRLPQAVSQQHNAANQLCWSSTVASANPCASPPAGATTYSYDTRGNRTTKTPASGPAVTYSYDQANRLKTVTTGATLTATNTYNGAGLRTAKTVGATTTTYTWDLSAGLPLMLIEGTNFWIHGPNGLPLARIDNNGNGTPLYHHHDRLGSTRLTTTSTGTVAATATYDPYGTPTTTGTPTSLGYTGQHHDPETGLYYLRARHYDPTTGQLLTRDPIFSATREPYGYVGGAALNASDPTGLYCVSIWDKKCRKENSQDASNDTEFALTGVTGAIKFSPYGRDLDRLSRWTGLSLGACASGDLFGGYDLMGGVCYMSTPSGESGFLFSAGAGGARPWGIGGLAGPSVSNAQSRSDLAGTGAYLWASGGAKLIGAGVSGSISNNACGQTIWQITPGWAPGIRVAAPISGGAGVSRTWAPGWVKG